MQAAAHVFGALRHRHEAGRRHRRVVHAAYRHAHHQRGAEQLHPAAQVEGEPERGDRGDDGDHDRQGDDGGIVDDLRRHQHRRHAGVVHAGHAQAHEHAGEREFAPGKHAAARDCETQRAGRNADQRREHGQRQIIGDRNFHLAGQHCDEMHRPDAAAADGGAGAEQRLPAFLRTLRGGDADRELQRGIRTEHRHQIGQQDENGVVVAMYRIHDLAP